MEGLGYTVTLEEFKLFHGIDRQLYIILVKDLGRDTVECLYIMGLWLWLERARFYNFISKILLLPPFLINELADEAVTCIKCLNAQFPFSSDSTEIPLTHSLVKKDISLQFFHNNRATAYNEIQSLVNGVCVPSLSDIMGSRSGAVNVTPSPVLGPSHAASTSSPNQARPPTTTTTTTTTTVGNSSIQRTSSVIGGDSSTSRGRARANEVSRNDRTMFVTFSKGYPVTEAEVRQFFGRLFGNCIESFHMHEVRPDEQSLYAKIVFQRPSFIKSILNGVRKAKFTINGKHVWMRKFVPKNDRPPPCGCPSVEACTCPN